ncbi:unnamed protein product [Clonostachys rhizophaga]|uniref:Xylanolytic transcriptional activator regulatory domain-containing protein n=1 Tax=Clonostachys rhizophaga TaxID=160324 RepID=A0A9N9VYR1_9HYPO|nr:unnamed protein product [Clonostachys rhizophaga]
MRDRNVTVSERFIRNLEARALSHSSQLPQATPSSEPESLRGTVSQGLPPPLPLVEDSTSEVFLARLKQIRQNNTGPGFSQLTPSNPYTDGESPAAVPYDFVQLKFDTSAKDRVWLCTLLVVFALGESYNVGPPPEIRLGRVSDQDEDQLVDSRRPPGTEFFEQAMSLLKISHEDPTIDQIMALNLITFYSYSLNRKKSAYVYAGMSARLSNVLRLHKPPSSPTLSAVECEHLKRVWWTVYCLDRMTSTEMGLPPIFRRDEVELAYPSDQMLPPEAGDEFSSGVAFKTQVQLAFIHTDICQTVRSLGDTAMIYDQKRAEPIIQQLENLRAQMPPALSFDVENGLPTEMREMKTRSLVSLYERYYQCFVLLLRPFFLKQINYLLMNDTENACQDSLKYLTNLCLRAARTNLLLIVDLKQCEKLATFGFWESSHLFSGLTILSLAISVNSRWPGSFEEKPDDQTTYWTAKGVLGEMAQAGNLASKGQIRMLDEVETLHDALTWTDNTAFDLFNFWDTEAWPH